MTVIVFEDEGWRRFAPLSLLRHTSLLKWGTKSLLALILESVGDADCQLWGREELQEVTTSARKSPYNVAVRSRVLLVNARARPGRSLADLASRKGHFAAMAGNQLVAARINPERLAPGVLGPRAVSRMSKEPGRLTVGDDALFSGYWQLVESNGLAIAGQAPISADFLALPATSRLTGPPSNLRIHGSAEIEDHVSFDTRPGPILIGEGASVEAFSRVSGPCYVGPRAKVQSALVRGGTSAFEGCRVGGEVENSILMPYTNKAHFGYVGDSYVGEWVNLGAGSTFSNLKNTYGNVKTRSGGAVVDTGMLKLGPVIGDMSKVSIGALVFAGKRVGVGSHVTGLVASDVPPFTYFGGEKERRVELLLSSVLETQRRMKERRGLTLSRAEERLISHLFRTTAPERRSAGVKKGRLT